MTAKHLSHLDSLVDDFLSNRLGFEQFQSAYSEYFIDVIPPYALSVDDLERYGMVHEKLDITAANPDSESRRYGWMDPAEFRAWLNVARPSPKGDARE